MGYNSPDVHTVVVFGICNTLFLFLLYLMMERTCGDVDMCCSLYTYQSKAFIYIIDSVAIYMLENCFGLKLYVISTAPLYLICKTQKCSYVRISISITHYLKYVILDNIH